MNGYLITKLCFLEFNEYEKELFVNSLEEINERDFILIDNENIIIQINGQIHKVHIKQIYDYVFNNREVEDIFNQFLFNLNNSNKITEILKDKIKEFDNIYSFFLLRR